MDRTQPSAEIRTSLVILGTIRILNQREQAWRGQSTYFPSRYPNILQRTPAAAAVPDPPRHLWQDALGETLQLRSRSDPKALSGSNRDADHFTGHSVRSGLATSAAAARASERSIMNQTGHRSTTMVRRYIRDGSLFPENPAAVWAFDDSDFCNPARGNEKGGVEGEQGYFRRNHLVPLPEGHAQVKEGEVREEGNRSQEARQQAQGGPCQQEG